MIPEYEGDIHVRIPIKHEDQIKQLIQEGKFKNITQVVRQALKEFLNKQTMEGGSHE
jgi:Arc/MetJ-type ribon-helix-helix transcriptional regulator